MASTIQVDTIKDIGGNTIISSNGSGTFTSNLPASAPNVSIATGTLPIANGGTGAATFAAAGLSNTPAFHASGGANGTVANSTDVIVANDDELFDSDGRYNTSTYRFTPGVAGKYYLYASARWQTGTNAATRLDIAILKNGSSVLGARNNNSDYSTVNVSGIVDLDADDYVEERSSQNTGNPVAVSEEANLTFFGGFRIIGA